MFNLNRQDLQTFSQIGSAFWADPEYSEKFTSETLAAATLLNLTPDRTLERASTALLECARRRGISTNTWINTEVLSQNFFRLPLEERFVLVALHMGKWSYARIGRILGLSLEDVEELAWKARLQMNTHGLYPSGPGAQGVNCPEYDLKRPWTQKFLDEEFPTKKEVFFLQNHLMVCPSCEGAIGRCREAYYRVHTEISLIAGNSDFLMTLENIVNQSSLHKFPSQRTFGETLAIFCRRPNVGLGILALLVLFLFTCLKFFH